MRVGKFALVGLSGLLVNEVLLYLLTEFAGLYFVVSSIAAVEVSIITNFALNERWTFKDSSKTDKSLKRFAKYNSFSLVGMTINVALLFVFTSVLGVYYLVSNALAVVAVFFWNYFVNRKFTWANGKIETVPAVGKDSLVSVIIPTYNEKENVGILVPQIMDALEKNGLRGEIIIVDDNSPDGTGEAAEKMKGSFALKVVHRSGKLGLSSAVLEGLKVADGQVIGVMDADLSHPPGAIPGLVAPILEDRADITVGSRYAEGGGMHGWPLKRKVISKGASLLAKPLTKVADPMSGFFFFKKRLLDGKRMNPSGYKIGLEIFVKSEGSRILEVPYTFADRKFGKSKLGAKEDAEYLHHLARLYWYKINR
jgi:dolichol-phosphate mannosyltransferase